MAAAKIADMGKVFNPQQQFPVTWPDKPVVALAYLDQLNRDGGLSAGQQSEIRGMMETAQSHLDKGETDRKFSRSLSNYARKLKAQAKEPLAEKRVKALAKTLKGIADQLR